MEKSVSNGEFNNKNSAQYFREGIRLAIISWKTKITWSKSHMIFFVDFNQQPPSPLSSSHSLSNGYSNNGIIGIKAPPTWFLLATFTMLSIIPPHQLLFGFKLCLFIKFINDNISCSHKCSCKSLRMTWLISNEKLINLGGLGLLLLPPLPKSLVVATQIVFSHQINQRQH